MAVHELMLSLIIDFGSCQLVFGADNGNNGNVVPLCGSWAWGGEKRKIRTGRASSQHYKIGYLEGKSTGSSVKRCTNIIFQLKKGAWGVLLYLPK
jgi:hypothetical protein